MKAKKQKIDYRDVWEKIKQLCESEIETLEHNLKENITKIKKYGNDCVDVKELADYKYSLDTYEFILERMEILEENPDFQ